MLCVFLRNRNLKVSIYLALGNAKWCMFALLKSEDTLRQTESLLPRLTTGNGAILLTRTGCREICSWNQGAGPVRHSTAGAAHSNTTSIPINDLTYFWWTWKLGKLLLLPNHSNCFLLVPRHIVFPWWGPDHAFSWKQQATWNTVDSDSTWGLETSPVTRN